MAALHPSQCAKCGRLPFEKCNKAGRLSQCERVTAPKPGFLATELASVEQEVAVWPEGLRASFRAPGHTDLMVSPEAIDAALAANPPAPAPIAAPKAGRALEARAKGYTGDMCSDCSNFTMVRNGTCLKCDTCGATSWCS